MPKACATIRQESVKNSSAPSQFLDMPIGQTKFAILGETPSFFFAQSSFVGSVTAEEAETKATSAVSVSLPKIFAGLTPQKRAVSVPKILVMRIMPRAFAPTSLISAINNWLPTMPIPVATKEKMATGSA